MTRRSITLVGCASLVLTACVSEGACSSRKTADSHAQDLAEIEKVHRLDVEATLAGTQTALAEGMTDDVVILQQGQEPEIGRQATLEGRLKTARLEAPAARARFRSRLGLPASARRGRPASGCPTFVTPCLAAISRCPHMSRPYTLTPRCNRGSMRTDVRSAPNRTVAGAEPATVSLTTSL